MAGRGAYALEPQLFGYAPVEAAETALRRAGIGWSDVGAVELNEAFAVQSLACIDAWGIDPEIVNVRGGAIAIGHPLGASGGRILGTLAKVLTERGTTVGRGRHLHRSRAGTGHGAGEHVRIDPMKTLITDDADAAVAGVADGSTILVGGFGMAGMPVILIDALIRQGATDLTVVSNNAGNGDTGLAALLAAGRVRKMICSFPRQSDSYVFDGLYRDGRIELEVVPQGNLAERMRAAGAGIGAFFGPTGVGTPLAEGKEHRTIDGRDYVLEYPIKGDVALIGAHIADRMGNLVYRKTARNFGPVMATAASLTIAQVSRVVEIGDLDPEVVVTPGIFVDRVLDVGARTVDVAATKEPEA